MPPPEPPPKPFDEPPPVRPVVREGVEVVGRSGRASVELDDFEVMRAGFFARFLAFFGWSLCSKTLALSPAAPPPAPVAKVSISFLAVSVQLEMTQAAKKISRPMWMTSETTRPSPPMRRQKGWRRTSRVSSAGSA